MDKVIRMLKNCAIYISRAEDLHEVVVMKDSVGSSLSENQEIEVITIELEEQFNPASKKIKHGFMQESYPPFESASHMIEQIDPVGKIKQEITSYEGIQSNEQIDPVGKKIKQEIIATSYEGIQSNFPPRMAFVKEEDNPEYKEISTTMPLWDSTRTKNKTLVSILKPATESTSKVLQINQTAGSSLSENQEIEVITIEPGFSSTVEHNKKLVSWLK